MNDLYTILQAHAARYPKMEPTDAVKLLYQSEFGGGHLISNEDACLAYLRTEWERTPFDPDAPLAEDIGGGVIRVMLAAIADADALEALGRDFIRSAANVHGTREGFLEKLALLRTMTAEGKFSFSLAELDEYLSAYERAGYPAVSHSETYRRLYHPAYRVLRKEDFRQK
jgi:hypothetical protein